ncbi:hypothetical protein Droror1_Dr00017280 [Drosera rotundifolia]
MGSSAIGKSDQYIHCMARDLVRSVSFRLTFIYARNESPLRRALWRWLEDEGCSRDSPWVLMGDFNAFMRPEEKIGYVGVQIEPCDDLVEGVQSAGVEDMRNVIYKVFSKMLAARMIEVLSVIINEAQGASVRGRDSVDNILLCQELMGGFFKVYGKD